MKLRVSALVCALLATVGLVGVPGASAEPTWAPAGSAAIHPGVQTITGGAQCTSNFVFFDSSNNVYIGQAAHCSGTGGATDTNGCDSGSLPVGTEVQVGGASQPGVMVYNSWLTMQTVGESDANTCSFNDFALIRLNPADASTVNPSIPIWGGPTGLGDATDAAELVYSYGNSSLRLGLEALSPKTGISLGTTGGGWTHPVYTVTPGIPGDSGSAFLDSQGRAIGVLSTLQLAPLVASNGVSDVASALAYMEAHTNIDVTLAQGTEAFDGNPLGLLGGLLGMLGLG